MLIPSIDIMGGRAVQLVRGTGPELVFPEDPVALAIRFSTFGTPAVIDLDAATGRGSNTELVKEICRRTGARAGGGIRTEARARELLRAGADRIILGTALWEDFVTKLPVNRVQAALDTSNGTVMTHGWKQPAGTPFETRLKEVEGRASSVLCTFIENEGTMQGIPPERVRRLKEKTDLPITVAGGTSSTGNAVEILELGVDLQAGMALYTGKLDPAEATARAIGPDRPIPTVVQDETGQVLMLAYSTQQSLREALRTGKGVYYSRSRNELWRKGETSGNTQELLSCRFDCDGDAILFRVKQEGPACHTGSHSCFGRRSFQPETLAKIVRGRRGRADSYTATLLNSRRKLDEKLLEEADELTRTANREEAIWEAADLLYFLAVTIEERSINLSDVLYELEGRQKG